MLHQSNFTNAIPAFPNETFSVWVKYAGEDWSFHNDAPLTSLDDVVGLVVDAVNDNPVGFRIHKINDEETTCRDLTEYVILKAAKRWLEDSDELPEVFVKYGADELQEAIEADANADAHHISEERFALHS